MTQRDTPPGVTPLAEEVELVQSASPASPLLDYDQIVSRSGLVQIRRFYASATAVVFLVRDLRWWLEAGLIESYATWWEFGPHARFVIAWRRA